MDEMLVVVLVSISTNVGGFPKDIFLPFRAR